MIYTNDFSRKFEIDLYNLCENSPYGARIISYHTAYHGRKYNFLDFWLQRAEGNNAVCALCRYYSTLIICGNTCNVKEIEEFIDMISPGNILCDSILNLNCNMNISLGETMLCSKLNNIDIALDSDYRILKLNSDMRSLKSVYSLLVKANVQSDMLPDFESYFLDISHRIRHGVAKVYVIADGSGEIVSTAAVSAISGTAAVIGCVATDSENRKRGLASFLVKYAAEKELSKGRQVYLHRERKILLYENIGFNTVGHWTEYTRKPELA